MVTVDYFVEAAVGDAARALFALLQADEPLIAHAFDVFGGKGWSLQNIGQDLHHEREIFDEALAAKVGDVGAAASADAGAYGFHGLVEAIEIVAGAAAAYEGSGEGGEAGQIGRLIDAAGAQGSFQHDDRGGRVGTDQDGDAVCGPDAVDGFRANRRPSGLGGAGRWCADAGGDGAVTVHRVLSSSSGIVSVLLQEGRFRYWDRRRSSWQSRRREADRGFLPAGGGHSCGSGPSPF